MDMSRFELSNGDSSTPYFRLVVRGRPSRKMAQCWPPTGLQRRLLKQVFEPKLAAGEPDSFRSLSKPILDAKLAGYAPVAYDNAMQKVDASNSDGALSCIP